jgi:hypothetical protein
MLPECLLAVKREGGDNQATQEMPKAVKRIVANIDTPGPVASARLLP